MKQIWVKIDPWDKKLVTTALESGADAIWVPEGRGPEVKALGLVTVIAPDGDLAPGKDLHEVTILGTGDEAEVVRLARQGPVVVRTPDWTVIPLENLVAQSGNIFVEVSDLEAARTALGVLEKGVDGLVVATADPGVIKQIARLVKEASPPRASDHGPHHPHQGPGHGRPGLRRHLRQHGPGRRHAGGQLLRRPLPGARRVPGKPLRGPPPLPGQRRAGARLYPGPGRQDPLPGGTGRRR